MAKIALITGATAGIGEATAHIFAENGYHLILTGRRSERLSMLKQQLESQHGVEVNTLCFDIRRNEEVEKNLQSLLDLWRKIDVLVNNAGLSQGLDTIQNGAIADWETMIDTNIKGLLYVTKIVSNWMMEARHGHIINLGSVAALEVYPKGNIYCATKHAVEALNKAMRIDLLPYGIRVTGIHPGAVETEFSVVRFHGDKERADQVYEGFEPLVARDVAETIWFAASRPSHVNISDLMIMPTSQASVAHHFKTNTPY